MFLCTANLLPCFKFGRLPGDHTAEFQTQILEKRLCIASKRSQTRTPKGMLISEVNYSSSFLGKHC